jgi:hypothetical protein
MLRGNLHVQYYFKRPVFRWQELPVRFFEMVYEALGTRLNIQPSELTINPTHSLGEARARYTIYGGASSVSLLADRISFDFPNLLPSDTSLVLEIMSTLHDAFPKAFPEVEQGRIEVQDYAHLDIGTQEAVNEFLNGYRIAAVEAAFGEDFPIISMPSVRYAVVAQDASWKSVVSAEPSQLATTALFGSVVTTLLKVSPEQTYLEKAAFVQSITNRCLAALNLESDNGA